MCIHNNQLNVNDCAKCITSNDYDRFANIQAWDNLRVGGKVPALLTDRIKSLEEQIIELKKLITEKIGV